MTTTPPLAKVGDTIVCRAVSPAYINPLREIRTVLENERQCAFANELLADPNSGWELQPSIQ